METHLVQPLAAAQQASPDPQHQSLAEGGAQAFSIALHAAIARVMHGLDRELRDEPGEVATLVEGDVEDDGRASQDEQLVQHLREMREMLRDELVERSEHGGCPPVQQRRLVHGMSTLQQLVEQATRKIAAGTTFDGEAMAMRAVDVLRDALEMGPETPRERAARGWLPEGTCGVPGVACDGPDAATVAGGARAVVNFTVSVGFEPGAGTLGAAPSVSVGFAPAAGSGDAGHASATVRPKLLALPAPARVDRHPGDAGVERQRSLDHGRRHRG